MKEFLITIILITGSDAMPPDLALRTAREAFDIVEAEVPVKIYISDVSAISDPNPALRIGDANRKKRWQMFVNELRNRKLSSALHFNLVIDLPLGRNGIKVASGLSPICDETGVAIVQAVDVDHEGVNRVANTRAVIAHEIGHLLGADHATDNTLMDITIGKMLPPPKHYNAESKKQILFCQTYKRSLTEQADKW